MIGGAGMSSHGNARPSRLVRAAEAQATAAELKITTQRLRAAQSVAGIGIFDWDLAARSLYWSPELYALMGLSPGAIEASPEAGTEALLEEDRDVAWREFRETVIARKESMEGELRLRQPDGRTRWVRLTTQIAYDAAGAPVRVLGAAVDIQDLKEALFERARALEEAQRTSRAKDEFLATLSHELRTPLNAILGWSTFLRKDRRDEAKLERGLVVIEKNARTQVRLVDDLLDVSRIIAGKLSLSMKRIELSAVVYAATDIVRPAANAKGVRLIVNLDPDLGTMVGDPDRLQQVVWNLLSNAIKFTPLAGCVTVTAHREQSVVTLSVQDTGMGIPTEHLPHIFERFRQVDGSMTRAQGGLGLGLAIVRHLVEAHGGTVTVRSDGPNFGTSFTVILPIRSVEMTEAQVEAETEKARTIEKERTTGVRFVAPGRAPLRNLRILVVDDDVDSLELIRVVIEGAGAAFRGVTSARQALDATKHHRFDVIISDIGMPEMDGFALIRRIRSLPSGAADVPAIALTAYARAEDADLALKAGYQQHLAKPVAAHELLAAVQKLLCEPG